MAQWESLQQLHSSYSQQLHELYDRDGLPMDVRHYLAAWIEKQEWERAAQDLDFAMVLYQVLLENLDNQYSRFVQEELFLMQHNIRRYKQNFQRYQESPCTLAGMILWFLGKEKEILQTARLDEQVQGLKMDQSPMNTDTHKDLERQMAGLRNEVQCLEHTLICLEEQQDEFDFKYKTLQMEVMTDKAQQLQIQTLLNKLNECRKTLLAALIRLLDSCGLLQGVLVQGELADWQRRQQRACIGAQDDVCLDQLDKWFTGLARCLVQVLKFLKKLEELMGKLSYDQDPFKQQKPLQVRAETLLRDLLKSSFVVETQPSMPQGKGPLVLRTNVQFSVKARLLVKFPELNHSMKVTVSMDRDTPQVKGSRRFNVLGTSSKALTMAESQDGGLVADFRHLTLKEQKSGGGGKVVSEISLSVTEELHVISFKTNFELPDAEVVELQASSLPVVIISNSSQQQSAWVAVLWFNMLSESPKDVLFFANPPMAPWPVLAEMLSWQFLSSTGRGLESNQLDMIAHKLFDKQDNYDTCQISWARFSKENTANANFTFWVWFDGILTMVKACLEEMWKDGFILGFVSKERVKRLLKKKLRGTFLLRFSESIKDGGVTFSWVDYTPDNEPDVKSVQPFTRTDLAQIPFHEIIKNFQLMEADNVPENPLLYLYPNIPKDQAFGKYYTDKCGEESPYVKYIRTKLVFVSKEGRLEAKSPQYSDMAEGAEAPPSQGELCGQTADGDAILKAAEAAMNDPLLSSTGRDADSDLLALLDQGEGFNSWDLLTLDGPQIDLSFQFDCPIGQL
ncbi:signal transducer and activator of transcription 2 isoform X1 [Gadus morhua]|uniref:Signal transducer and activator of transcription n=1 Tax=Gadus morhua TaxID=8049 RepID=A0A8C5ADW3_GADMO|nr:signal transducer and activator of transcription 1-alpha/beta-like isoform X1 [Gadus morhua]